MLWGRNEANVSDGFLERGEGGEEVRKRGVDGKRGGWFDQTSKEEVCPNSWAAHRN
jgi:hypothetical protein